MGNLLKFEDHAEFVFAGDVTFLALGQVSSEAWQEASVHRSAGLAGQLNIETVAPG